MEGDGTVLGKNRILDPDIDDAMDAARQLQQVTNGSLQLSSDEEFALIERMGSGLLAMKTKALLADPERFARHFLS